MASKRDALDVSAGPFGWEGRGAWNDPPSLSPLVGGGRRRGGDQLGIPSGGECFIATLQDPGPTRVPFQGARFVSQLGDARLPHFTCKHSAIFNLSFFGLDDDMATNWPHTWSPG